MSEGTLLPRRTVLATGAALGLVSACGHAPSAWAPPAPRGFRVIEHEWIVMRDGIRLSARLWIPESATSPAVLECIPYRKRDLYRAYDDIWGKTLAEAGIAFVRVDVRGTGDSEGFITDEYSELELDDCEEIIAWMARQDWCSGAVGMRGLSWGGINTLQVAARQPPALKAIMPMGCCDNRYTDDAHYIGGTLARANFQWGVLFKTVMAGPPDPEVVGDAWRRMWQTRLHATPAILSDWTQHQREGDYWRRGSVSTDYASIKIPTYLVSGWDDTYATPVLRLLEKLTAPTKALIGPWGHTYPNLAQPLGLDWAYEEVRWWRHWLAGDATGIMNEPRLRCYMPYTTAAEAGSEPVPGRWIAEASWPRRSAERLLYLNSGSLGTEPERGASIVHRDKGVIGTTKPEWLDRLPIEQSHDDALSTVFDGKPLAEPFEILGAARVRLSFVCDKPAANLVLRLCELRPDGRSWLVTWGILNLTRRDSMSDPRTLATGEVDAVDIDLRPIAHRFSAGSRIRLSLSEGWWPMIWPTVETSTFRIAAGYSTLDLPVRPHEKQPVHFPIPEIRSAPGPVASYQPVAPDANSKVVVTSIAPATPYTVAGAGIELSSSREEVCEIVAGDPLSSRWRQTVRSSWSRGDWRCTVEASYELSCDRAAFRLKENLRATFNGEDVIALGNEARIPRDLI
ncbi:MAG: CocE/NonD family hydrolase [Hyphomonadaceae bacterium]|nr:CocE/NonD family hydrolase [Hyphomonadaceae bacterium]